MEFIPMLTYNDLTVENALEVFDQIAGLGIGNIGFKNVGVDVSVQERLVKAAARKGISTFMEIVSTSRDAALKSFETGVCMGVDNIIGGTYPEEMVSIGRRATRKIGVFPFAGVVYDHPNKLKGDFELFRRQLRQLEGLGVDGVDLLAFRYVDGDPYVLLRTVVEATDLPVIVAGSIDSPEKIRRLRDLGVWGFTVGTALFEKKFGGATRVDQVYAILKLMGE
jgi:hypothetical protein